MGDHWAIVAAQNIIREKGEKDSYTVASGITPSGVIHIGNFREVITVDLVKRALENLGKKVRFIYSWDDFDVFRKVPKDMPEALQEHLRKAIVDVPDPYGEHDSYAKHHEAEFEKSVELVGIKPEYIYQHAKYRNGYYADGMKIALQNKEKIKDILNQWRKEPLDDSWYPITGFCTSCKKDTITIIDYDGEYGVKYKCECGHEEFVNLKEGGNMKLAWRIDWPMRWEYEKVDFEPGGKDHSTKGGSYSTGREIVQLYNWTPPTYQMYDFISIKGAGGKISSSAGNVVTLKDCLEIYEPEIIRFLFAGTRPNREFAISFDADVIATYEKYDRLERAYFDGTASEKDKLAYEFSAITLLEKMPYQPGFRHLTMMLQIVSLDIERVMNTLGVDLQEEDKKKLFVRLTCAKNWIEKYAPEDFTFSVQETHSVTLEENQKKLFCDVADRLTAKEWTDVDLHEEMYILCKNNDVEPKEFFKIAYQIIINKERGPKLASFILEIGREKVANLFKK